MHRHLCTDTSCGGALPSWNCRHGDTKAPERGSSPSAGDSGPCPGLPLQPNAVPPNPAGCCSLPNLLWGQEPSPGKGSPRCPPAALLPPHACVSTLFYLEPISGGSSESPASWETVASSPSACSEPTERLSPGTCASAFVSTWGAAPAYECRCRTAAGVTRWTSGAGRGSEINCGSEDIPF